MSTSQTSSTSPTDSSERPLPSESSLVKYDSTMNKMVPFGPSLITRFPCMNQWRGHWVVAFVVSLLIVTIVMMLIVVNRESPLHKGVLARQDPMAASVNKPKVWTSHTRPSPNITVCRTPVCRVLGEAYAKTVNFTADPCHDFYAFTCAGLQKDYDLKKLLMDPRTLSSLYRLRSAMKEIGYAYLREIYNQSLDASQKLASSDKQMAILYGSCLKRDSDEEVARSVSSLKSLFSDVRLRWFDESVSARQGRDKENLLLFSIGRLSLHWGLSMTWLSFRLAPTAEGIARKILEVKAMFRPTGSSMPGTVERMSLYDIPRDHWTAQVDDAMRKTLLCLSQASDSNIADVLRKGAEYRWMLTKTELLFEGFGFSVNPKRLSELALHQAVGEHCLSKLNTGAIPVEGRIEDFERVTGVSLVSLLNRQFAGLLAISSKDELVLDDVVATAVAVRLLENPGESELLLEDCLAMWLVRMLAPLIGGRVTKAACLIQDQKVCHTDNVAFCEDMVHELLPLSGAALIGRHIVSEIGLAELRAITDLITTSIAEIITTIGWMDPDTKTAALKKINDTWTYIGYPDRFNQPNYKEISTELGDNFLTNLLDIRSEKSVLALLRLSPPQIRDAEIWRLTTLDTNAAYVSRWNGVLLPSTSLGLSYYVEGAPIWINVASSPIAREILHGFDVGGSQFDDSGRKRNWWSERTLQSFKNRTMCFIEQYSMPVPFYKDLKFNGEHSLSENLADNGGLRALYRAFKMTVYMNHGNFEILPGLERFTPSQMFFIAWAYKRCRVATADESISAFHKQTHAYAEHRVNIPLMNFDEFGKAFNCPRGSSMRPREARCSAW